MLKTTRLLKILFSKMLKTNNNNIFKSINSNKANKTIENLSKFQKLKN